MYIVIQIQAYKNPFKIQAYRFKKRNFVDEDWASAFMNPENTQWSNSFLDSFSNFKDI